MPYIITITPRRQDPHALHYDHHADICAPDVTRTAVATLDEARGIAFCVTPGGVAEALNLPADGGTIGPLPDGTVIEVRRELVTPTLAREAHIPRGDWFYMSDRAIIAEFNRVNA